MSIAIAAAQPAPSAQPLVSPSAARSAASNEAHWEVLGRSVEDRVIEFRQFGQGARQILVVGPLEGDETAGIELIEQLAEHLERFPRRTSGARVTLVRDPNPDGRLRRSAYNARGVRLDRNFPTRGWRKVPSGTHWLSGREPESEPETRALVDLLNDLRPDRVLILAATRRRAELAYAGPADDMARDFAKSSELRPTPVNVAAEQGSLAVYAGADHKTPTLVVRVLAGMRPDQLWSAYKRALLSVMDGEAEASETAPANQTATSAAEAGPSPPSSPPAQPLTVLAATRLPPKAGGEPAPANRPASGPRVLSADDLKFGGTLAPVVRAKPRADLKKPQRRAVPLRRQFGPVTPQPFAVGRGRGFSRAPSSPPSLKAVNLMRPSMAPPKEVTSPGLKRVERLPTFGPSSSPQRRLPTPIPLYPETGY